jgi:hypothetical protein
VKLTEDSKSDFRKLDGREKAIIKSRHTLTGSMGNSSPTRTPSPSPQYSSTFRGLAGSAKRCDPDTLPRILSSGPQRERTMQFACKKLGIDAETGQPEIVNREDCNECQFYEKCQRDGTLEEVDRDLGISSETRDSGKA